MRAPRSPSTLLIDVGATTTPSSPRATSGIASLHNSAARGGRVRPQYNVNQLGSGVRRDRPGWSRTKTASIIGTPETCRKGRSELALQPVGDAAQELDARGRPIAAAERVGLAREAHELDFAVEEPQSGEQLLRLRRRAALVVVAGQEKERRAHVAGVGEGRNAPPAIDAVPRGLTLELGQQFRARGAGAEERHQVRRTPGRNRAPIAARVSD